MKRRFQRPKALITGSAGFLGRYFHEVLMARGWDVWGYDITSGDDVVQKFSRDLSAWERMDLVVHCAAVIGGREGIDGTNMMFTQNVLLDSALFEWAVRTHQKRVLYISSSAVYSTWLQTRYHTECIYPARLRESDMKLIEDWPEADAGYGLAKCIGEWHAKQARNNGLPVTVVRPFSGYGPDQSPDYPFRAILERSCQGNLSVWGPKGQTRDWVHVSDVVEGALAVAESGTEEPVNICTGVGTEMGDLAQMMYQEYSGVGRLHSPSVQYDEGKPTGVFYRVGNPDRFFQYYTPKYSIEQGVIEAVQYYQNLW